MAPPSARERLPDAGTNSFITCPKTRTPACIKVSPETLSRTDLGIFLAAQGASVT